MSIFNPEQKINLAKNVITKSALILYTFSHNVYKSVIFSY